MSLIPAVGRLLPLQTLDESNTCAHDDLHLMGESAARPQVCRFRPLALLLAPPGQAVRGALAPSQRPASSAPSPRPNEYEGTSHFRATASSAKIGVSEVNLNHYGRGSPMRNVTRVGVDLAKNLIQVHAVDAAGKVVTNRALKREKFLAWCADLPAGCLVAMEACSGAHHWCRQLRERGFDARMIPAQFVSPYRIQGKSGKNDANDAAAVCEAASRPHMNFVPPKTLAQQGMLCVHRLREAPSEPIEWCSRGSLAWLAPIANRLFQIVLADGILFVKMLNQKP